MHQFFVRHLLKQCNVFLLAIVVWFSLLANPTKVLAHEQYVLTKAELIHDLSITNINVLDSLKKPENLVISIQVGVGIAVALILLFFFHFSPLGKRFGSFLEKFEPAGHLLLRVAFAGSLIASATFHAFLGPEISVTSIPGGNMLIPLLYTCGILLLLGLFTRIASFLTLLILIGATFVYGEYITTYLNYYGELLALTIFGSYVLSVDNKIFGVSKLIKKYKNLEILLIRVTYGVSVMYPAITLKIFHPAVIIDIVNKYNMTQFHWLFPSDPLLISLGTGIAQIMVGLMIIVGLATRYASFATFWLYLLSVLFFKEAVWPHYILLALALYLTVNNGGKYTFDELVGKMLSKIFPSRKKKDILNS